MRVMITGAAGQVGRALLCSAPADIQLLALTRSELDITDATAVHAATTRFQPEVIINAAAYTAVDAAEEEPERAAAINAVGPGLIAMACTRVGARLIHISTDYVFDGEGQRPYRPDDITAPLGVYGVTKRTGERAVQDALGHRAVIVRTAWVYASTGKNFLLTMLRLMRERDQISVVADQHGTPTAAVSVAQAIWAAAGRAEVSGTLHWTDGGATTWHGFALAIAAEGLRAGLLQRSVDVVAIPTSAYPTRARRPRFSVLDTDTSAMRLGLLPTPWRERLQEELRGLVTQQRTVKNARVAHPERTE